MKKFLLIISTVIISLGAKASYKLNAYRNTFNDHITFEACYVGGVNPDHFSCSYLTPPEGILESHLRRALKGIEIKIEDEYSGTLKRNYLVVGGATVAGAVIFPPAGIATGAVAGFIMLGINSSDREDKENKIKRTKSVMNQYLFSSPISLSNDEAVDLIRLFRRIQNSHPNYYNYAKKHHQEHIEFTRTKSIEGFTELAKYYCGINFPEEIINDLFSTFKRYDSETYYNNSIASHLTPEGYYGGNEEGSFVRTLREFKECRYQRYWHMLEKFYTKESMVFFPTP